MTNIMAYNEMEKLAKDMADSGMTAFKTKAQALTYMMLAQSEGRHPVSVARDYHFIEGKHCLNADAMLSRYMESGGSVKWLQYTHEVVEANFKHPRGSEITLAWTQEDAARAELTKKDEKDPTRIKKANWRNFPRAMLRSRLISEGIRASYPSVIVGSYTPDEIKDLSENTYEKEINSKDENIIIEPMTYIDLMNLIEKLDISQDTIDKWCEREGVKELNLISQEYALSIIVAAKQKFGQLLIENKEENNESTAHPE